MTSICAILELLMPTPDRRRRGQSVAVLRADPTPKPEEHGGAVKQHGVPGSESWMSLLRPCRWPWNFSLGPLAGFPWPPDSHHSLPLRTIVPIPFIMCNLACVRPISRKQACYLFGKFVSQPVVILFVVPANVFPRFLDC